MPSADGDRGDHEGQGHPAVVERLTTEKYEQRPQATHEVDDSVGLAAKLRGSDARHQSHNGRTEQVVPPGELSRCESGFSCANRYSTRV